MHTLSACRFDTAPLTCGDALLFRVRHAVAAHRAGADLRRPPRSLPPLLAGIFAYPRLGSDGHGRPDWLDPRQ